MERAGPPPITREELEAREVQVVEMRELATTMERDFRELFMALRHTVNLMAQENRRIKTILDNHDK